MPISLVAILCYVLCVKVRNHCCMLALRSHELNAQALVQSSCWGLAPVPLPAAANSGSASAQK